MTQEEKAKAYDKVLEWATEAHKVCDGMLKEDLEHLFPELKESDDEKIKKFIIHELACIRAGEYARDGDEKSDRYKELSCAIAWLEKQGEIKRSDYPYVTGWRENRPDNKPKIKHSILMLTTHGVAEGEWLGEEWCQYRWSCKVKDEDVLYWLHLSDLETLEKENVKRDFSWLEKQDKQKPTDYELTSKALFKKGDWITNGIDFTFQVISIEDNHYLRSDDYFIDIETADKKFRLWTIQDAKDGDILAFDDETIVIFKDLYKSTTFHSYCHIKEGAFNVSQDGMPDWWDWWSGKGFHPATKEQRDTLMKAMADAGYTFDFEKKELKKIEQKPAWSEEDETGLGDAMWAIEQARTIAKDENEIGNLWYAEKWLKSIKGRYSWKPSEEQIIELHRAISGCSYDIEPLIEIEEHLKKLKEE